MIQKIISYIEKHNMISENDLVVAGISGGADSLCLLFVLLEYQKKVPFNLVVVHVNHLIRQEAGQDADFVKEICQRENIPFYLKEVNVEAMAKTQHLSTEEAGRNARYRAFEEAVKKYQEEDRLFYKIAVAHHQGDQAETMLFHLFRGTGIYGMAGILPVNGKVIRPLLSCSRKEIEEFLRKRGQEWCIDCSNEEDTYTRNKIRHHILGYANREINEKATEHVAKAASQMASLRQYLEGEVEKIMEEAVDRNKDMISINLDKLKKYPEFLQSQCLMNVIDNITPGRRDIGSEHIQSVFELMDKTGTKKIDLPKNLEVVKEYGTLWIKKKEPGKELENESKNLCYMGKRAERKGLEENKKQDMINEKMWELKLEDGKQYVLEDGNILEISFINPQELGTIEEKTYTKYFDYDRINHCLMLRFRQSGDYVTINDQGQRKTIKEYFINEKVPASIRSRIPLIADGDHILWIIGYRISAYYKVTTETQRIVQMTIRRDKNVREN